MKKLLRNASNGRYDRDKSVEIRDAARCFIGSHMPAKSLELRQTIRLIHELDMEIAEIGDEIKSIMDELHSTILTIPGIGCRIWSMIPAEIGDFSWFDSPDKILAYAGLSPSIYRAEGEHYNVATSHAAKKLVRLIYALEKSQQPYKLAA